MIVPLTRSSTTSFPPDSVVSGNPKKLNSPLPGGAVRFVIAYHGYAGGAYI